MTAGQNAGPSADYAHTVNCAKCKRVIRVSMASHVKHEGRRVWICAPRGFMGKTCALEAEQYNPNARRDALAQAAGINPETYFQT